MRSLDELVERAEPGIDVVREGLSQATHPCELLDVDRAAGERAPVALQITDRLPMGAPAPRGWRAGREFT